jgi:hypothetical protein
LSFVKALFFLRQRKKIIQDFYVQNISRKNSERKSFFTPYFPTFYPSVVYSFLLGVFSWHHFQPALHSSGMALTCRDLLGGRMVVPPDYSVSLVCEQALNRCIALHFLMFQLKISKEKKLRTVLLKLIVDTRSDRVFWLTACQSGYANFRREDFSKDFGFASDESSGIHGSLDFSN